jgi:hypothetical protein
MIEIFTGIEQMPSQLGQEGRAGKSDFRDGIWAERIDRNRPVVNASHDPSPRMDDAWRCRFWVRGGGRSVGW